MHQGRWLVCDLCGISSSGTQRVSYSPWRLKTLKRCQRGWYFVRWAIAAIRLLEFRLQKRQGFSSTILGGCLILRLGSPFPASTPPVGLSAGQLV